MRRAPRGGGAGAAQIVGAADSRPTGDRAVARGVPGVRRQARQAALLHREPAALRCRGQRAQHQPARGPLQHRLAPPSPALRRGGPARRRGRYPADAGGGRRAFRAPRQRGAATAATWRSDLPRRTGVICRAWNWREAERTKLTEQTTDAFLCIEALPPTTTPIALRAACADSPSLVTEHLGGTCAAAFSRDHEPDRKHNLGGVGFSLRSLAQAEAYATPGRGHRGSSQSSISSARR